MLGTLHPKREWKSNTVIIPHAHTACSTYDTLKISSGVISVPSIRKSGNFDDLHARMEQIQNNRLNRKTEQESRNGSKEIITQVQALVRPVINAFIESDRSLLLQSADSNSFFVSFGYSHVIHVSITASSEETIAIMLQSDSHSHMVYSGDLNQRDIQDALKTSLLDWYENLFSKWIPGNGQTV